MIKRMFSFEKKNQNTFIHLAVALVVSACMAPRSATLSAQDQTDISRIEDYLNAMPRFEAHFEQSGAFGPGAGLVWIDRPGHLRIDYEGAGSRTMVIAGGRVKVLDRSNGATTTMPLSRTPLAMLLTGKITLSGAVTVAHLHHTDDNIDITLKKTDAPGQGSLELDFSTGPLVLQQVTVTDPYGRSLTMRLDGIDTSPRVTPELFASPEI